MKKIMTFLSMCAIALALFACAGGGQAAGTAPVAEASPKPAAGLLGMDEAVAAAAAAVEAKLSDGTPLAVYKITTTHEEIGAFFAEDLNDKFISGGKLRPLAREKALSYVEDEQDFQMSGLVSDETAVGIGHYVGAEVVITGTFDRYAGFSQFRVRAVDVKSSALVAGYTGRIANNDPVLESVASPFKTVLAEVAEDALTYLNRGKDFYSEGKYDEAIREFDKAIAADRELGDAYLLRGGVYGKKGDKSRELADYSNAYFLLNDEMLASVLLPSIDAIFNETGDHDTAIAFLTKAINTRPLKEEMNIRMRNFMLAEHYKERIAIYNKKRDTDGMITDYTSLIKLEPDNLEHYENRALIYFVKKDYDNAIADYTELIRHNPNDAQLYNRRAEAYHEKKDYNNAIADFTQAIRLAPNDSYAYSRRAYVYYDLKDYDSAIASCEAALRVDPDDSSAKTILGWIREDS